MEKWVLCLFSGGLDSCGALYSLLTNPEYNDYDIHVHSLDLINKEDRYKKEYIATSRCVEWFKANRRGFEFTRSCHEYLFMDALFKDAELCFFMASQIVAKRQKNYTHIAFGSTADDIDQFGEQSSRMLSSYAIRDIICEGCGTTPPGTLKPVKNLTKQEIWDMLPIELRNLTWSCRTPKDGNPCGTCITCKDMKDIR